MSQTLSRELYKSSSMCMKRGRKYREGERNEIDKKGGKETKDCIPLKKRSDGESPSLGDSSIVHLSYSSLNAPNNNNMNTQLDKYFQSL